MEMNQLDAMLVQSETILAGARAAGERMGLDGETAAMPILINALATAVVDMAGPDATTEQLERAGNIACDQLFELIHAYRVVHASRKATQHG